MSQVFNHQLKEHWAHCWPAHYYGSRSSGQPIPLLFMQLIWDFFNEPDIKGAGRWVQQTVYGE